jgi:hypothetical protein
VVSFLSFFFSLFVLVVPHCLVVVTHVGWDAPPLFFCRFTHFLLVLQMLFALLAPLFCLSFVAGAPCTVLSDLDEIASLTAAGYTCSSPGVVCDDSSGTCHVVAVPDMYVHLTFSFLSDVVCTALSLIKLWSGSASQFWPMSRVSC